MKTRRRGNGRIMAGGGTTGMVLAGWMLLSAPRVFGRETKIPRASLPPAVERAVQEQTGGAEIKGLLTKMEHGARVYEVETVVQGRTRDIQIAREGSVVEMEEEEVKRRPGAVRDSRKSACSSLAGSLSSGVFTHLSNLVGIGRDMLVVTPKKMGEL